MVVVWWTYSANGAHCRQRLHLTLFSEFSLDRSVEQLDAKVDFSKPLTYGQYRKSLSRWLPEYVGAVSTEDSLRRFGTKSGRVGGATAAVASGIDKDEWTRHGGWTGLPTHVSRTRWVHE